MSNIAIDKTQRTTNSDIKLNISEQIATTMLSNNLINETQVRDVRDIVIFNLYNFSLFQIECTELSLTDEEDFQKLCEFYATKKLISGIQSESITQVLTEVKKFHDCIQKRIEEVTTEDIDMYLIYRMKNSNIKKSTLHGIRLYLSSFFSLLYKNRKITDNPMDGVESIKEEVTFETPLSKTEIAKLEDSCVSYREKAILSLLLESGLRVTEFSNLNIEDLNFQKMEVFVHLGKGKKDRTVPFGEKSSHMVQQYLTYERKDINVLNGIFPVNTPLFVQNRSPYKRLSASGIQDIIKTLGRKANIPRIHPHLLRKTYATTLYKQGIPVNVIAKLLGHANLDSISRYVVINDTDIKKVLNNTGII